MSRLRLPDRLDPEGRRLCTWCERQATDFVRWHRYTGDDPICLYHRRLWFSSTGKLRHLGKTAPLRTRYAFSGGVKEGGRA